MPRLHAPGTLAEVLAEKAHDLTLIASLDERRQSITGALEGFRAARGAWPESVLILIGPEGDFSPQELQAALDAGATPVTLGPNVLRAETAATVAVAIIAEELRLRGGPG